MEKDKIDMTRRFFSLTLEIVFLLTGEDFMVVRECGELISRRATRMEGVGSALSRGASVVTKPPARSRDSKSEADILKLSSKIIHLLTGEIRRFSVRNGDPQLATPPNASNQRNPAEGSPRPLHSQDSMQEEDGDEVSGIRSEDEGDPHVTRDEREIPPDLEEKSVSSPTESSRSPHWTLPASSSNQLVSLEGKIYVCYDCGKCAIPDTDLQQVDVGKSSPRCCDGNKATPFKPFLCVTCGKSFSSKMVYMAHQGVHSGGQSFPCAECGLTFSNKSILETHQSIHTGDRPFSCSECGKCFAMKANLVKHLKVHKGEKPFSCQDCGKSFSMKSNLVKHRRIHTGEKPFECAHCRKTFGTRSNLVKHRRIHTGEKPFKCLECSKCFSSRSNLATHEKIHTGEKRFVCSFCGKGFITSSDLSRHQKTHTREPFICSDCGRSFISKSLLDAHQKTHTGDC